MTTQHDDLTRILRARDGDAAAIESLLVDYKPLVGAIARPYYLVGADTEDLVQDGMIGLHRAVRTYDPQSGTSFRTYAYACVRNCILDSIKRNSGNKHRPLNDSVPLDTFDLFAPSDENSPEAVLLHSEAMQQLRMRLSEKLSDTEKHLLRAYLSGWSYARIAKNLGISIKRVDNSLQALKRKLRTLMQDMPLD